MTHSRPYFGRNMVVFFVFRILNEKKGGRRLRSRVNTKHLYHIHTTLVQRSNIVKMLYKCFVFAGSPLDQPLIILYIHRPNSQTAT